MLVKRNTGFGDTGRLGVHECSRRTPAFQINTIVESISSALASRSNVHKCKFQDSADAEARGYLPIVAWIDVCVRSSFVKKMDLG